MDNQQKEIVLAMGVSPFCQITGKKIRASLCAEMQGGEGCFGCAAETRLCEQCKNTVVDVPAVGLCSKCLYLQLQSEKKIIPDNLAGSVSCQITNQTIGVKMCLTMQGQEGCSNCSVTSRLCEKCKERQCRYPLYGYCLHCTIEEFGEGWQPDELTILSAQLPTAQPKFEITSISDIDVYMPQVRELLPKFAQVSNNLIMQNLGVSSAIAKRILSQCEHEGLVSEAIGTKPRKVLIRKASDDSITEKRFSKETKIEKLRELIHRLGPCELSEIFESIIIDLNN